MIYVSDIDTLLNFANGFLSIINFLMISYLLAILRLSSTITDTGTQIQYINKLRGIKVNTTKYHI